MNGNSVSPTTLLKSEVHHPLQPLPSSSPPNSSCTPTSVSPETITAPNNSMHQLGQQLLCNMNSLLTISNSNGTAANNSNGDSTTSGPVPVFTTKEQLAEQYQLAKLRLNQDLLGASAFYSAAAFPAYAFASSPYAEAIGGGKMGGNHHHTFLGPNGYHHHRFRYGAHPSLPHHHHHHHQEDPKPQHSYIGLIAMAILSMPEQKMVLSDIYQHILDHYPYFRNRGPGWRNSIRHNLSLNDCFIKSGRSANGKGHYWAIHPANLEDFRKGDFRRRKAQRKVRKHMGLSVPDDDEDDDDDGGSPGTSPVPGVVGGILSAEKAAMAAAAAAAAAANLLSSSSSASSPNPFVQAAIAGNPMFQLNSAAANPVNQCAFSAQAFNFFNSLRFAAATAAQLPPPPTSGTGGGFQAAAAQLPLPPAQQPSNAFNETLYRQLINLNIKQDLQSAVNRVTAVAAAAAVRNNKGCSEFSIESLLSSQQQQQQNPMPEQQQQQQQQVHPGLYNGIHHHPLYHHPTHHHHFQLLHQRTASTEDSDVDSETEGASFLSCKGGGGGGGGKGGNDSELSIEEEITSSSSSAASSLLSKCEHGIKQQQQLHLQPVNLKIN